MGHVQVRIRSLDLTESVIEAFSKQASKLCQKGVGVMILTYRFLLRLTELVLGVYEWTTISGRPYQDEQKFIKSIEWTGSTSTLN